MATVYIDKKFSKICSFFVDEKDNKTGEKTFKTYMDLAVFSALVGFSKPSLSVENNGTEIPDSVFFNNKKEGIVYLIALLETKDPYIFNDERKCWKIFEGYVNAGLLEISGWLEDNPTDISGTDTLLNNIAEKASLLVSKLDDDIELPMDAF